MIERDYILRMTQQLAAVVARLFKLKEQEHYDQAQQEVEKAFGELLGMEAQIAMRFETATLAQLLGNFEKMKALATLFFEQAELHRLRHQLDEAKAQYQRALEMFLEALLSQGKEETECREKIQLLLQVVEVNQLATRYQDALRGYRFMK